MRRHKHASCFFSTASRILAISAGAVCCFRVGPLHVVIHKRYTPGREKVQRIVEERVNQPGSHRRKEGHTRPSFFFAHPPSAVLLVSVNLGTVHPHSGYYGGRKKVRQSTKVKGTKLRVLQSTQQGTTAVDKVKAIKSRQLQSTTNYDSRHS